MNGNEIILPVASGTIVKRLAGSIYNNWLEGKEVVLSCIGAGAVNQAVKAVIVSGQMFSQNGKYVSIRPGFKDIQFPGDEHRTAIVMQIEVRS